MAHIQRLIALLIFAFSLSALASVPQIPGGVRYTTKNLANVGVPLMVSSVYPAGSNDSVRAAACNAMGSFKFTDSSGETGTIAFGSGGCNAVHVGGLAQENVSASCPANSTASGSSCTCDNGYRESGGACVAPLTADEWCKADAGFGWNNMGFTGSREGRLTSSTRVTLDVGMQVCHATNNTTDPDAPPGCKHLFTPDAQYSYDDGKTWIVDGYSWQITEGSGLGCVPGLDTKPGSPPLPGNPDIPKLSPPGPCKGIPGEVNGVSVCLDPSSAKTEGVDWSQTTDGQGNKSDVKNEVKCDKEQCTVTTTTTPTAGGTSTTSTSNVSRTQYCAKNPTSSVCGGSDDPSGSTKNQGGGSGGDGDKGDGFCKENPDSPICKQSSFGGSCAASFTCDGDAIQCAVAKEQHIRNCRLFDDASDESRLYEAEKAKDKNRDVTADLPGNQTVDISSKLSSENVLGGGSCVSDLNITVMQRSITLPISSICPQLAYLGYILVAIASLVAVRIVGGSKE
jgi:hypothetical protein